MIANSLLGRMACGGIAGLLATWPMTRFMSAWDRVPVESSGSRLPPREITEELIDGSGRLSENELKAATRAAHYGYGAAVGCLYPVLACNFQRAPLASGTLFGMGVWLGSYYGLLPAMGSRASAPAQPPQVNAAMVAAHLVWGVTLGILTKAFLEAGRDRAVATSAPRTHDQADLASAINENPGIAPELAELLEETRRALDGAILNDDERKEAFDDLTKLVHQLAQPHPNTKLVMRSLWGLKMITADLKPVADLSAALGMIYSVTQ